MCLVIGETGVGKSTHVNNILGKEVAPVGNSTESMTPTAGKYRDEVNGMPVVLYDTPGLGDSQCGASDPEEDLPTGKSWYIPLWLGVLFVLSPKAASAFIGIHHSNVIIDNDEQHSSAVEVPSLYSIVANASHWWQESHMCIHRYVSLLLINMSFNRNCSSSFLKSLKILQPQLHSYSALLPSVRNHSCNV